jgi:anti-sigma B factor antagonist
MNELGDLTLVLPPTDAGGARTLKLAGEFDLSNNHELEQAISEAIDAGTRHFIIDLSGVTFLDGTTLNTLVLARKRCARRNGRLVLVRPPAPVWRVFVLTGMSRAFATYASQEAAEQNLVGHP